MKWGKDMNRKVLDYDGNIMLVEIELKKDEVGDMHSHEPVQFTYVLEGKFEFVKGKEKIVVSKGDTLYFESGVEHGVLCLEDGKLLDVFNPIREDLLEG